MPLRRASADDWFTGGVTSDAWSNASPTYRLVANGIERPWAGTLLSSSGYALAPYIDAMKIPMVYPVVSADDLTQRRRSPWIVLTGWTGSQPNHAFGEYAYHTLKLRRVGVTTGCIANLGKTAANSWNCSRFQ